MQVKGGQIEFSQVPQAVYPGAAETSITEARPDNGTPVTGLRKCRSRAEISVDSHPLEAKFWHLESLREIAVNVVRIRRRIRSPVVAAEHRKRVTRVVITRVTHHFGAELVVTDPKIRAIADG